MRMKPEFIELSKKFNINVDEDLILFIGFFNNFYLCGDFKSDKEINLTAKEFDILELLATNPNKVFSRDKLLAEIWGNKANDGGDARTVDVHVRRLREKIEPKPSELQFVHTKWGIGYFFNVK